MILGLIALILFAVALAVMVVTHVRAEKRLAEQVVRRQAALDKQAKVFVRRLAQSNSAANKLIDESREAMRRVEHVHEDTRQLHQTIDAFMADRRVQAFLNTEGR